MTFIDFIKFLVSIGLSPVEIGTIIVAILLYRKSEQLDAALHNCLGDDPTKQLDRIDPAK